MNRHLRAAIVAACGALALSNGALAWGDYGDDGGSRDCASGSDRDWRSHDSLQVVGLTADAPQRLVCFNERRPGEATTIGTVSGLVGDTRLVGIDFRVQDRMMYGVGNAGGLYRIDTVNAIASRIGALSEPLSGTAFGVDFNPAANALRIVSDNGQNLRQSFANLDANLPLAATAVDGTLNNGLGATVNGITGAAYTNNDLSAQTGTTLFDLSSGADQVLIQSPANSGTVVATGSLTVDAQGDAGFDIYSTVRNGVTVDARALASLRAADGSVSLYSVDLLTGKATRRGGFSSRTRVIDIAIPLNQL